MSPSTTGYFGYAGGGKNGATVDIWAASRFVSAPAQDAAPPSGAPDAGPVTTGVNFGGPGAYTLPVAVVQDYYLRIEYGGHSYWSEIAGGSLIGGSGGGGGGGGGSGGVLSVLTGLTADNGVTDNGPAINTQLTALGAAGGGVAILPVAKSYYGTKTDILVPQGVTLAGGGPYKMKNPGGAIPSVGNLFGSNLGPAAGGSWTSAIVVLQTNTAGLQDIGVFGNGGTESGNIIAPRAIMNEALAARIRRVFGWGGQIAVCDTQAGNGAQDTNYIDSLFLNNLNNQGIALAGCAISNSGTTITIPSTPTGLEVGMGINAVDGSLLPGTYIAAVNSPTSLTLSSTPTVTNGSITLTVANNWIWVASAANFSNGSPTVTLTGSYTTAGMFPGMAINGSPNGLPTGAYIASITDATHFNMSGNASHTTVGATIDVQMGLTLRITGTSDCMLYGVRTLDGTVVIGGANCQTTECHFSGGSPAGVYNLIQCTGQGTTYANLCLDSATNIPGLFRRDAGVTSFAGVRLMNGNGNTIPTAFPALTDNALDAKGISATSVAIPKVGTDGFSAMCLFTGIATPAASAFVSVAADSVAIQSGNFYTGGTPGRAAAVFYGGVYQIDIPTAALPITTKGDIIVGNGGGAGVRLPIGTNGQVLTADSTQPDGAAWEAVPGVGRLLYKSNQSVVMGVSSAYGALTTFSPDTPAVGIVPIAVIITWSGTFTLDTANVALIAHFSDGSATTTTYASVTATGVQNLGGGATSDNLTPLFKDGLYITSIQAEARTNAATTSVACAVNIAGMNVN